MSFAHLSNSMLILLIFSYRLQRQLKCVLHREILHTQKNDIKGNFSDRTHDLCNNKLKNNIDTLDIKYNLDYIKKNPNYGKTSLPHIQYMKVLEEYLLSWWQNSFFCYLAY